MLFPPPPPPPPSPPLPPPLFPLDDNSVGGCSGSGDHHYSYNPSILIIAAIVASAIIAAASIHLLLRSLSRSRSPSLIHHLSSSSSSPSTSSPPSPPSDQDPKAVIDSLPLFSLSASTSKFPPPTSLDCAVCLSSFTLSDELRLLPSCRHAFHSQCIDTWLKTNLSCPLCRSPIGPIPSPQTLPAPPESSSRSESFRVEIGSVSRRTNESSSSSAPHVRSRSYSLGSSFEYVVEDEIEAVIARIRRRPEKPDLEEAPPPPAAEVVEMVGGSQRSWLKEYVDRLASSASSSFSSLRFSQRGSHRFDSASTAAATGVGGVGESWDLERNLHLHLEDDGLFGTFYRWILGV